MVTVTRRDDSELGTWTLVDSRPEDLIGLVESIWFFDGESATRRERHFPTGTLDLIVHLGGGQDRFRVVQGGSPGPCAAASVGGLLVGPMVIEAPEGPCRVLGVRLTPAGAFALLGGPLGELTGLTVDLHDLVRADAQPLVEGCEEAGCDVDRVRLAAAWIRSRLRRGPRIDRCVAGAVREIERSGGGLPVSTLGERLGVSRTRLRSTFRDQIGVTPKRFARIVRFRRAAAALREGSRGLSRLALQCGYYDQAHMNAEFRAMSGVSPLQFLDASRPEQVSLAE